MFRVESMTQTYLETDNVQCAISAAKKYSEEFTVLVVTVDEYGMNDATIAQFNAKALPEKFGGGKWWIAPEYVEG